MAFSKYDLDAIKSKLFLSREIEKKTKVIKKGKDAWCCCLFHDEKTHSLNKSPKAPKSVAWFWD